MERVVKNIEKANKDIGSYTIDSHKSDNDKKELIVLE